eukprot:TRINITY_DN63117_c0_g1_i1.p1 TRINITY_DN63117_c0_g1~~TRINITY_DN63117_c0_g1_i1.p1  ORF type:complete len:100 (-),score=28.48 TRINITY_DN63117_c0_g1_i1:59-358(-)
MCIRDSFTTTTISHHSDDAPCSPSVVAALRARIAELELEVAQLSRSRSHTGSTMKQFTDRCTDAEALEYLSLIHISEPTRLLSISYAVFCLKKKKTKIN